MLRVPPAAIVLDDPSGRVDHGGAPGAADPLAAQLETEYGIAEIPSARAPVLTGLGAGISFAVGLSTLGISYLVGMALLPPAG